MPELLVGGVAVALVALAQAAGNLGGGAEPGRQPPQHVRRLRRSGSGQPGRRLLRRAAGGRLAVAHRRGDIGWGTDPLGRHLRRASGLRCWCWSPGSAAEIIPMPVIGGLILVIGVELVAGRLARHQAGAAGRAAVRGGDADHVRRHHPAAAAHRDPDRRHHLAGARTASRRRSPPSWSRWSRPTTAAGGSSPCPSRCPSNDVTVLHYARRRAVRRSAPASTRNGRRWRAPRNAVVVLSLRDAARRAVLGGDQGAAAMGRRAEGPRRPADHRRCHPGGAPRARPRRVGRRARAPTASCPPPTGSSVRWRRRRAGPGVDFGPHP